MKVKLWRKGNPHLTFFSKTVTILILVDNGSYFTVNTNMEVKSRFYYLATRAISCHSDSERCYMLLIALSTGHVNINLGHTIMRVL